jgi:stage V sporulation protein G
MNTTIQVTDVRVYPVKNGQTKVRAFAQLVLNGCFKVTGLRVIEGDNGLFIGYPSEKGRDGKYYEIIKPINRSSLDVIQDTILRQYEQSMVAA